MIVVISTHKARLKRNPNLVESKEGGTMRREMRIQVDGAGQKDIQRLPLIEKCVKKRKG